MPEILRLISPVDGRVYAERPLASAADAEAALALAVRAGQAWQTTPLSERVAVLTRAIDAMGADQQRLAEEITWQMGRPIAQTPGEIKGMQDRARYMLSIAASALAPVDPGPKEGFARRIERVPVGVVAVIAPWNYPYLTAINAVVPALAAGNAVILKHSQQTALCAERLAEAFLRAGVPEGVFAYLHLANEDTERLIADRRINFVCFTGSVATGHVVQRAVARGGFTGVALELGGKDPAYVRADANLPHAIENLVDGAMFNSGQSCCAIERIYVHEKLFDDFVAGAVDLTRRYRLGDPTDPATNLGPLVRTAAAEFVRAQVGEAVRQGARTLVRAVDRPGTPYMAPEILVNVDHSMRVMTEETFGPVVGVMKVSSDEEAVHRMNDSPYGLSAAIWTGDRGAADSIGARLATGTVFMNRCDYLDPALAWVGVKDSGRGCSLSRLGYEQLTRPKSFHYRLAI
ncbi:MAG: aldehyde dehydrogenase family protein [Rhodospirillaceae bacterium]